uniref:Uncharacterized protein n=1 Tax=Candidatus Kentrum sp. DK TaxID=2126562 RepID=A0A450T4Y0_9GAMM|nr:MAG: hypothetical protein BECKDK2373B_GA0170837_11019 [Candidatus Kentron sp. DK]
MQSNEKSSNTLIQNINSLRKQTRKFYLKSDNYGASGNDCWNAERVRRNVIITLTSCMQKYGSYPLTALKTSSKCSFIPYKLRFLVSFRLVMEHDPTFA